MYNTDNVYEEAFGQWRRLPCDVLHAYTLSHMGNTML
jgi:hypothetical protein